MTHQMIYLSDHSCKGETPVPKFTSKRLQVYQNFIKNNVLKDTCTQIHLKTDTGVQYQAQNLFYISLYNRYYVNH